MPIPLIPPAVHAAAPSLLAATAGPWWALPLFALVTGLALMYLTELAKARFGRGRNDVEIEAAREKIAGDKRDDYRDLITKHRELMDKYGEVINLNAEMRSDIKIQTYQIENLRLDVTRLEQENAGMVALKIQVSVLEGQVRDLKAELRDRDAQITRLTARSEARQDADEARAARLPALPA